MKKKTKCMWCQKWHKEKEIDCPKMINSNKTKKRKTKKTSQLMSLDRELAILLKINQLLKDALKEKDPFKVNGIFIKANKLLLKFKKLTNL